MKRVEENSGKGGLFLNIQSSVLQETCENEIKVTTGVLIPYLGVAQDFKYFGFTIMNMMRWERKNQNTSRNSNGNRDIADAGIWRQ